MTVHPTAIVSPDARLAQGVEIGAYSVIGPGVTVGRNTFLGSHVVIERDTDIGEGCRISSFCSLGGDPQDLKYEGEKTRVIIGNYNVFREYVTVNRATSADIGVTIIGDHNLIMAYCHVAHNCKLGNHIVISNGSHLAGHIHVYDYAIISGMVGIHQFTRIGAHSIIGGASAVTQDVPPYVTAAGNHAKLYGLNLIGLERRGFSKETISALKEAYRIIFRSSSLRREDALEKVRQTVADTPEVRHFIDFIQTSERGVCH
jgi:UDP-N-acetylglucosamine acyltransferase